MDRQIAVDVVTKCLRDALEQFGAPVSEVSEETVIVGGTLDSIGVVSLIVDIEQHLEIDHDVSVTLASEKAMSQRNSPFRSVGVLADHVCEVVREGKAA